MSYGEGATVETALAISPPPATLVASAAEWVERVDRLVIAEDSDLETASQLRQMAKATQKDVESYHDPKIKQANAVVKLWRDQRDKILAPVIAGLKVLDFKIDSFAKERDRRLAEERRRLEEEAKKRNENELMAQAERMSELGFPEEAERILERPTVPAVAIPAPVAPKTEGLSFREDWSAECYDMALLVSAVAKGEASLNLLLPNGPAINALGRTMKSTLNVPGIRPVVKKVPVTRLAR